MFKLKSSISPLFSIHLKSERPEGIYRGRPKRVDDVIEMLLYSNVNTNRQVTFELTLNLLQLTEQSSDYFFHFLILM